jgi:hypothetical protein
MPGSLPPDPLTRARRRQESIQFKLELARRQQEALQRELERQLDPLLDYYGITRVLEGVRTFKNRWNPAVPLIPPEVERRLERRAAGRRGDRGIGDEALFTMFKLCESAHRLETRTGRPGDHRIDDYTPLSEMAQLMEGTSISSWDAAWEVAGADPKSIINPDARENIRKRLYRKFEEYGRVFVALYLVRHGLMNELTRSEIEQILKDYNASTGGVLLTADGYLRNFPEEYLHKLRLAVSVASR